MDHIEAYRRLRAEGRSLDEALHELRQISASPIACILVIKDVECVTLAAAKSLFSQAPSSQEFIIGREQFEDLLEAAATAATIYVALEDETVDVWRPVVAASIDPETFRILSSNSE